MIEELVPVIVAEVQVTDNYDVELRTHRKRTELSPENARALAAELVAAADLVEAAFRKDFPALAEVPMFDVAPVCRDCAEGKHGACIGSTFVETTDDVAPDEVECGCSKVSHKVIGAAPGGAS